MKIHHYLFILFLFFSIKPLYSSQEKFDFHLWEVSFEKLEKLRCEREMQHQEREWIKQFAKSIRPRLKHKMLHHRISYEDGNNWIKKQRGYLEPKQHLILFLTHDPMLSPLRPAIYFTNAVNDILLERIEHGEIITLTDALDWYDERMNTSFGLLIREEIEKHHCFPSIKKIITNPMWQEIRESFSWCSTEAKYKRLQKALPKLLQEDLARRSPICCIMRNTVSLFCHEYVQPIEEYILK